MGRLQILGFVATAGWLVPQVADACSAPGTEEAIPDSSLADDEPPTALTSFDVEVKRGRAPECRLGRCSRSSCDAVGFVTLTFDPASDDQTGVEELAYQIELVEGDAPDGLIPNFTFRNFEGGGRISLQWSDGATDDQEALDFTIVVRAVDQAGNVGPDSEPVIIADPGGKAGCSIGRDEPPVALLLLPLLGFAARRRSMHRARARARARARPQHSDGRAQFHALGPLLIRSRSSTPPGR